MPEIPSSRPIKLAPPALQGPSLELLAAYSDWRQDWTHIVSGTFSASRYSGLLFYARSAGVAAYYATDGAGGIWPLKDYDNWSTSWDQVVAGKFGPSGFTGLVLYDQGAGFGAIYDTDGQGNIVLLQDFNDWRTTWTHIVAGRFYAPFVDNEIQPSPYSGLLFYEQSTGYAEMYSSDGHGGISLLSSFDAGRTSWTHIVAGEFINSEGFENSERVALITDDLFFYEGSTGYGETYQSDGMGGIGHFDGWAEHQPPPLEPGPAGAESGLPMATLIAAGSFGGRTSNTAGVPANLIFHDRNTGRSSLRSFDTGGTNRWLPIEDFSWSHPWDLLLTGNFWMADPDDDHLFADGSWTDLLFYEQNAGYGEIYLHEPPAPTPIDPFAGYPSPRSAAAGDTIQLYISSQVGPYTITLYRQEEQLVYLAEVELLSTEPQPMPISRTAYKTGANWPACAEFTIPSDWPSGLYFARVAAQGLPAAPAGPGALPPVLSWRLPAAARTETAPYAIPVTPNVPPLDIPFVVRAGEGSRARILYAISDNTYNAYNYWGGRSLYGYGTNGAHAWVGPSATSFHAPHACRVSFLRPNAGVGADYALQWQRWEVPLLQWIHRQGIAVDVCAESDLHTKPGIVTGYRLLVLAGHSEYWSGPMRDEVEGFVRGGGNVVFFSGNTCWWQVRFEDGGDTMVCYKQAFTKEGSVIRRFDPAFVGPFPQTRNTTVNWFEPFLHRPETQMTGVRYNWAKYPPMAQFVVDEPDHWLFANTGLNQGDGFGLYDNGSATVVGEETDVLVADVSPPNFRRLAHVQVEPWDVADMGLFSPNDTEDQFAGIVFTAATMNWVLGLSQDGSWNPMDQITRNLLIRLG
jgi:hypothetical protein